MNREVSDEFRKKPSILTAECLGQSILEVSDTFKEKRAMFAEAFSVIDLPSEVVAVLNLWAVGALLESDFPVLRKVEAVRGAVHDPQVTASIVEKWVLVLIRHARVSKELLDLLAIDMRNMPKLTLGSLALDLRDLPNLSSDLLRLLGHPNPN